MSMHHELARAGYTIEETAPVLRKLATYGIVERSGDGWRFIPGSELPW